MPTTTIPFRVLYLKSMRDAAHGDGPASVSRALYDDVGVVEAEHLEDLFRDMNAVVDGTETCCRLRVRSMSVGDVAIDTRDESAHYCASEGWIPVELAP